MHFQADDRCTAAAKDLVLLVQWSIPARPAMVPVMPASHVAARAAGVSCAAAAAAVDAVQLVAAAVNAAAAAVLDGLCAATVCGARPFAST